MKLSARNILKGTIVEVKKGQTTAHVRIDVGGMIVTAAITNEAVDDLKLQKGQQAYAVIKASSVMIGVDCSISQAAMRPASSRSSSAPIRPKAAWACSVQYSPICTAAGWFLTISVGWRTLVG